MMRRGTFSAALVSGVLFAIAMVSPVSADAAFGLSNWQVSLPPDSSGTLRAGAHPDEIVTRFDLNSHLNKKGDLVPDGGMREVKVDLPAGFIGAPNAMPTCNVDDLVPVRNGLLQPSDCPINSIIGWIEVRFVGGVGNFDSPIFNMTPPPGAPAQFGFNIMGFPQLLTANARNDGDYGVTVVGHNISQGIPGVLGVTTTFWGVPADPSHDNQRCDELSTGGLCVGEPGNPTFGPNPASVGTIKPFLTNPTSCSAPGEGLRFDLGVDSWEQPSNSDSASDTINLPAPDEATPLGTSRCDRVPFTPHLLIQPTTDEVETTTGLEVALTVPPDGLNNPVGISQSHLKDAKVSLPKGMSINPSYGDGVTYCSASQVGLVSGNSPEIRFSKGPASCPDAAQLADVRIDTPLINEPLIGAAYVAQQNNPKAAGVENPFDSTLALYIVAEGSGVRVKLAGRVAPDQKTGQVVTTFLNNPQVPFSKFALKFKGGQRAPLSTPPTCGTYAAEAELTPWARPGEPVTVKDSFNINKGPHGGPCPSGQTPPFHPGLLAGTLNNAAGRFSPFHLRLTREDGEQEFTHFSIKLPPGLVGKLAGIPFCADGAIEGTKAKSGAEEEQRPSCPKASEVGRTEVGAGVGSLLVYAPGKVYLAGPYHGSALSVAAITAAKVGPFDLGTVVVRQALKIDPETAEVFIDATGSDPIPHIIDGIPVHARDIRVYVDKPGFVLNPTDCDRTSTASTVLGSGLDFASEADDNPITVTSPFQAADCAALPFKPKLSLRLVGGTKRGAHPAFKAHLKMNGIGEAAIQSAQVTLPHSEFLENAHIKTICTRVQFKAGAVPGEACPAGSVYGYAKAITPILDEPLQGPVFLRSSEHQLPDLVAALHNGKINVNLIGRIDSVKGGGIRNTFEAVPDAPVDSFTLTMQGGKKGLLVNSTNLCKGTHRAEADFDAHNGKSLDSRPELKVKCKGKGRKGHKRAAQKRPAR